jgi:outer membrane autotransporter protein
VAEHLYGGHFPLTGTDGYGADVTPQGPDQSKTNSAIWARASGSWTNQSSTVDTGLGPFNSSFNQDTYTLLGGVDMSPDAGASGLRLGAFGGYGQSNLSFSNYGTTGKFTGGEVGGYAAYTQGGFYADAQVDGDFMRAHFDAPIGGGATIDTDGTALGVLANIGDRMYTGKNFFEPLASFAYVNTSLGDQTVGGDSVHFSNGESLRAGVGARIGTTQKVKDGLVEYTLLGRVWNEFAGDNTVTISDGVNPPQTFTDNNHGVLGEVSGTVTFADTKTNLSTFISGGGIFGADSTTWDAKAGVRKEF